MRCIAHIAYITGRYGHCKLGFHEIEKPSLRESAQDVAMSNLFGRSSAGRLCIKEVKEGRVLFKIVEKRIWSSGQYTESIDRLAIFVVQVWVVCLYR